MKNPLSLITKFPSTKHDRESFIHKAIEEILNGNHYPLEVEVRLKNLEEIIKQEKINRVLAAGDRLTSRFNGLALMKSRATRIRCHGDYHLGQVLRVGSDWILLDFEGEPLLSLAERQKKHSPLKDIAGMLRSFAYAAMHVLLREQPAAETSYLPERLHLWQAWVQAAFLHGYLTRAAGASFLPVREKNLRLLLSSFLLDKAMYEAEYELNNRPDWLRIPLDGILALLEGESSGPS